MLLEDELSMWFIQPCANADFLRMDVSDTVILGISLCHLYDKSIFFALQSIYGLTVKKMRKCLVKNNVKSKLTSFSHGNRES